MKDLNKYYSLFSFIVLIGVFFQSCTVRDDWPDFPPLENSFTDPSDFKEVVDTEKSRFVTAIENKNITMFKTFISDTTWSLATGVTYAEINFIDGLDQRQKVYLVEADLNAPNITVVSMSAFGQPLNNRQVISAMTKDNDGRGGKIIAAINGDNMVGGTTATTSNYGIALNGFVFYDKVLKATAYTNANRIIPYLGVKKGSGEVFIGNSPNITTYATDWHDQSELEHQVSGPTWALYDVPGLAPYTNMASTSVISRHIVGINEAENKVYFVALDGNRAGVSAGMALHNISAIIRGWGVNKAFMPYYAQYGQLVTRIEDKFGRSSFPLANVPTTTAGANSIGTLANGFAIVLKQ